MVAIAIAIGVLVGSRVLARDRRAIYEGLAQVRQQRLEVAATELVNDIEKIGKDLQLALTLGRSASDTARIESDFRAITAIARHYVALALWAPVDAAQVRVEGPGAKMVAPEVMTRVTSAAVEAARRHPGALQISGELPDSSWLRVIALAGSGERDLVAAVVVDMRTILGKLRLLRGADSALLVLGGDGTPTWISDDEIERVVRDRALPPSLAAFVADVQANQVATRLLDRADAAGIGLPEAAAVAVGRPVAIPGDRPWAIALVTSTLNLRNQEQMLVRRMLAAVVLLGALLLVLAGYVVRSARRSAELRERWRHVERLAHLTDKAEKILDHIPSGVLAISEAGRVTAINARLREHLGEPTGQTLEELFASAPHGEVAALLALVAEADAARAVRSIHGEDWSLFGARGRYNLHAVPLERRLPDVHMLVVAEDQRAVQSLEGQLLHSEKLATMGVLAAGIAHEIGTPLNIARGWAERGQSQLPAGDPHADIHGLVIEQIDHVTALIGQLLDFVRPQAVPVDAIDTGASLSAAVGLLGPEAQRRGISLCADAADPLPPVLADARQLQQVLVNLIVNALDACERGGHVTVRATDGEGAGWVRFEVTDDGCGIPRSSRHRIFDPFFTTKKRGRGTGLGLSVVDQLVRSHGGRIDVVSEAGAGTSVRVSWPTAPAAAGAAS